VVFDRHPRDVQAGRQDGLEVAFASRQGRDAADHDIAQMVAADVDPGSLTIVTSDGPLAERVRGRGAAVMGAGTFRRQLDQGERSGGGAR